MKSSKVLLRQRVGAVWQPRALFSTDVSIDYWVIVLSTVNLCFSIGLSFTLPGIVESALRNHFTATEFHGFLDIDRWFFHSFVDFFLIGLYGYLRSYTFKREYGQIPLEHEE